MEALKSAVSQGTLGDLRVARAEFGKDLTSVLRAVNWSQAGGGLLDMGIYCIQFISMVFGGQKPEKILAVGRRYETGMVCPGLYDGDRSDLPLLGTVCWEQVSQPMRIRLDSWRKFPYRVTEDQRRVVGRLCTGTLLCDRS